MANVEDIKKTVSELLDGNILKAYNVDKVSAKVTRNGKTTSKVRTYVTLVFGPKKVTEKK